MLEQDGPILYPHEMVITSFYRTFLLSTGASYGVLWEGLGSPTLLLAEFCFEDQSIR